MSLQLDPFFDIILEYLDVEVIGPPLVSAGVINLDEFSHYISSPSHLSKIQIITRLTRKLNNNVEGFLAALERTKSNPNHSVLLEKLKSALAEEPEV